MAYDPLTGKYTPDPVPTSGPVVGFKPKVKYPTPAETAFVGPKAPTIPATPGQFRQAEEVSNVGAPLYTPTPLAPTGEFNTSTTVTDNDSSSTLSAKDKLLLEQQRKAEEEAKLRDRQSAYDILYNEFNRYGLGSLVENIKYLLQSNVSPSQFSLELQNTDAYKKRFSANQERIKKGLSALTPAEYINLEDQYQNIMRNYGLPSSYYAKDDMGKQAGFDQLLANDVSAAELEDRVMTAQQRVVNANPEVAKALRQFYPDVTNGDILAYALDPSKALDMIKRKVTAAEIGGAAKQFGLLGEQPSDLANYAARADELAGYGLTQAQARQGFQAITDILPRGSQLASIYKQEPYTLSTAESEIFGTPGAASAAAKRKKLTQLEQASFSGSAGTSNAISRDRAGAF